MEKNHKRSFLQFVFFLFIAALFLGLTVSCRLRAEQKSLTSHFEMVDILIADNQFTDAVKELKKIEKQVYDSWSYIGVYKRYAQIGEDVKAEKSLKKQSRKILIILNCLQYTLLFYCVMRVWMKPKNIPKSFAEQNTVPFIQKLF